MTTHLILTCEHAGRRVPTAYESLFRDADDVLESHRGSDPGALALARAFQRSLAVPLFFTTTTRLLVEPNRSVGHPRLFSEFTAGLDKTSKQAILDRYYHPHRNRVESWIDERVTRGGSVFHLSLHTFTPQLNGQVRHADVGLLYDPSRVTERDYCHAWRAEIKQRRPALRVRRNYPYLGKADGFTTYLRRRFALGYVGIELEVNQRWPASGPASWRLLKNDVVQSFLGVWQRIA